LAQARISVQNCFLLQDCSLIQVRTDGTGIAPELAPGTWSTLGMAAIDRIHLYADQRARKYSASKHSTRKQHCKQLPAGQEVWVVHLQHHAIDDGDVQRVCHGRLDPRRDEEQTSN